MIYLAWKSMRGRKRETAFLASVLVVSFAFSILMAILLPSTERMTQQDRENTYGGWQMLLYDRTGRQAGEMEAAAASAGADAVRVRTVGRTQDGEDIAVLDDALQAMGNFTLSEGSLPQEPDELLIVANQFQPNSKLSVGDSVSVTYLWDSLSSRMPEENTEDAFSALDVISQKLDEGWDVYFPQFQSFWDGSGRDLFLLGEDYQVPADSLTKEQALYAATIWALNFRKDFRVSSTVTYRPTLLGDTENQLTLRETINTETLLGEAFGDLRNYETEHTRYKDLTLRKTYRVCGILQSYAGTWDLGDCDVPAAFVSADGSAEIAAQLAQVRNVFPDLVYPTAPALVLFRGGGGAAALYDALLPAYAALQPKTYRIEGYTAAQGGRASGYLVGRNEETGELAYLDMSIYEDTFYVVFLSQRYAATLDEIYTGQLQIDGLSPLEPELPTLEELYAPNTYAFRVNAPAFPREDGTVRSYSQLVLSVTLSVMAGCAVLTVCLIQSKKRVRSLLTWKAIGMENRQAAGMLLAEGSLFWVGTLAPGSLLGVLAAWLYLSAQAAHPIMALHPGLLLVSLAGITLAVVIGFTLPLLMANALPLTGRTAAKPPKPPKARRRRGTSYLALEREKSRFYRKKTLAVQGIAGLMLLVALLTLTLAHQAFSDYRAQVQRAGRPDYVLTANYGQSNRFWQEQQEAFSQLAQAEGVETVQTYVAAEDVMLACDSFLEKSPILSWYRAQDETRFTYDQTGALCYVTDVIGLDTDSSMLAQLSAACTEGVVDPEKLEAGEGCILLVPMYRARSGKELQLSYDPGMAQILQPDPAISVGDRLHLSAESHSISEDRWNTTCHTADLTVMAILRYFPEDGVWPFAGEAQGYVLVSGAAAVRQLYPKASLRLSAAEAAQQKVMQRLHCEVCDGKTYYQLYCGEEAVDDAVFWSFAQNNGYSITAYRQDNEAIQQSCAFHRFTTVLLGIVAELLLLTILVFLVFDLTEQERKRIGILRALGLSRLQMLGGQVILATGRALAAAVLANLVIAVIWAVSALAAGVRHWRALAAYAGQAFLWQYPWRIHLGICAGLWLFLALLLVLPYIRIGRQTIIQAAKEQEAQ